MTSLQFSFEADQYLFSLCSYTRSHPHFVIEVTAVTSSHVDRKQQYLIVGLPVYFSGTVAWQSSQPYIASSERLIEFADTHPGVPKGFLQGLFKMLNDLPDSSAEDPRFVEEMNRNMYKLFVFPCEKEPVYIIALYHSLHNENPRE